MEKAAYTNILKPSHLPQVTAPYSYVVNGLKSNNIPSKMLNLPIAGVKPMQKFINSDSVSFFLDKIKDNEVLKPIYVSKDNEIIDGHHRYAGAALDNPNGTIMVIRLDTDYDNSVRSLNKIQDIYTHESGKKEEECTDCENESNPNTPNQKVIIGYRNKPMVENSKSGNFFNIKDTEDKKFPYKYEIEFDNILELDQSYENENVKKICSEWHDMQKINETSVNKSLPFDVLVSRMVVERAKKMGYDGIKYGEKYIQTL
jgi:hypothetical protein